MTSGWPGLVGARGRRSHRVLEEENESPGLGPASRPCEKKPLSSSLDALRTRLGRRLPLGALEANFRDGPSWEPLEAPKSPGRTGLSAGDAQKIHKPCQGSDLRTRRSARLSAAPSPGPRAYEGAATPSSQGSRLRRLSKWITKDPLLPLRRRRSQREAALRSPYASPAPLCSPRGRSGGSEEEEGVSVSIGTQQLKHLSQSFEEAIATDERKQAKANYHALMTHNLRAVYQSQRLPWTSGRRHARGLASKE